MEMDFRHPGPGGPGPSHLVPGQRETFVGRQAELAFLTARLEEVRSGQPRIVLVEGPSGMGKTALLRRFLGGMGPRLLQASGEELERIIPYGVLDQLVAASGVPPPPA
jgi:Holliday junction resolvasome RuvABC ATP-dependent DNA helicase subunit